MAAGKGHGDSGVIGRGGELLSGGKWGQTELCIYGVNAVRLGVKQMVDRVSYDQLIYAMFSVCASCFRTK